MKTATKIVLLGAALVILGLGVAAQFVTTQERSIRQPQYTSNSGELVRDTLVGQTFVSEEDNLSGVAVMFATYSQRANTKPIRFHLRDAIAGTDVRTGEVSAATLNDNQFHRFNFPPISDSAGTTYFFFVVSPESTAGNAVAVDVDTRDPYHRGSAYLVRGQGAQVTDPAVVARSGKPTVDLAFATFHTVPLRVAVVNGVIQNWNQFIGTWQERVGEYSIWARMAAMAVVLIALLVGFYSRWFDRISQRGPWVGITLALLLLAGVGLRFMYAVELPVTTDEGSYLYDARTLLEGRLAGGDGYVKAPLVIVWIAIWQLVFGYTIIAGRFASVLIGALTLLPLYAIGRELAGRRAGLAAAAIWALAGVPIVFAIYAHTQPLALFFGISGLAVLLLALRGNTPQLLFTTHRRVPAAFGWFLLAGVLLGLGVASRKSVLALGLVPLALILIEGRTWKQRLGHLVAVGIGFALVIGLFLGFAWLTYGEPGVWEALGFNSAEDGLTAVDPAEADQVRAYNLRGMTPFFRESLPLILLSMIGLGTALETWLRGLLRRRQWAVPAGTLFMLDHILPKLLWVVPLGLFWWALSFFFEYEGEAFMFWGIPALWYAMGAVLVGCALLPRPWSERLEPVTEKQAQPETSPSAMVREEPTKSVVTTAELASAALFGGLWLAGLIIFYRGWFKFHVNYVGEFIPPLVVLAAQATLLMFERLRAGADLAVRSRLFAMGRRVGYLAAAAVLLWALFVSNLITFMYEHTGTFDQQSLREAAAWAREHISADQPIFTGAAIVPYLSGHHTALDISHPRWYAYEFTRKDPERLQTFLPSTEAMMQAYGQATWFLLEKQTGFSFLMEYSDIESGLERDFVTVNEVENMSNPLIFKQRVR